MNSGPNRSRPHAQPDRVWNEFDGMIVPVRIGVGHQELIRLRRAHQAVPQAATFDALVDTGAQISCIDSAILKGLGLPLFGVTPVNMPALGGLSAAVQYAASLTLVHPSSLPADELVVTDIPLTEVDLGVLGYQVLLGRDVLRLCSLRVDGPNSTYSIDY